MLDFSFGGAFDAYARLDARQLELIRSLEWLTFDPSTYSAALSQANALARHFLGQSLFAVEILGSLRLMNGFRIYSYGQTARGARAFAAIASGSVVKFSSVG